MTYKVVSMFLLGFLMVNVSVVNADSEKEKAAISEALKWLSVVDEGKYEESWKDAAEYFKVDKGFECLHP